MKLDTCRKLVATILIVSNGNLWARTPTLLILLLLGPLTALHATELFISPSGNDADAGTKLQPFASVARARQAARTAAKTVDTMHDGVGIRYRLLEQAVDAAGRRLCPEFAGVDRGAALVETHISLRLNVSLYVSRVCNGANRVLPQGYGVKPG